MWRHMFCNPNQWTNSIGVATHLSVPILIKTSSHDKPCLTQVSAPFGNIFSLSTVWPYWAIFERPRRQISCKSSQNTLWLSGFLKTSKFKVKNAVVGTLSAFFCGNCANFYCSIWSHCLSTYLCMSTAHWRRTFNWLATGRSEWSSLG